MFTIQNRKAYENTVVKEETAAHQHFLLFLVFPSQWLFCTEALNLGKIGTSEQDSKVNFLPHNPHFKNPDCYTPWQINI